MEYQHGGDIYRNQIRWDYSANINPMGMPESIKNAVIGAIETCVHYPDSQSVALRQAISDRDQIPMDWIICSNGAADVIFQVVQAKKPKKALVLAPTFSEYEQALGTVGCQVVYYDLSEEQGFKPDLIQLSHRLDQSFDMAFLCNPNNPTGEAVSKQDVQGLIRHCEQLGILLVVDECFCDFIIDEQRYSAIESIPEYKNLMIVKAFTKMYGMAGIRLGYGICSDRGLLEQMLAVRQPWSVSALAQAAGIAALKESGFVKMSRDLIHAERPLLRSKLEALGFTVFDSKTNYLLFRDPLMSRHQDLYLRCKEKGLLIRSCANYRGLNDSFYRVCVKTRSENEQMIQLFKEVLEERDQDGKSDYDTRDHVQCRQKPDSGRTLQDL